MAHSLVKTYIRVGQRVLIECAFSEACMHMRVAGRLMYAEVLRSEAGYYSVQLYTSNDPDGMPFSFPIGVGEAGFYQDEVGKVYYYLPMSNSLELFGPLRDRAST